jgi:siroheme synthase (precorrin-2 oxidase/ferrochelatase)
MAEELHVLFGGGQVGHPLSRILLGCGKRVRIVKRSACNRHDQLFAGGLHGAEQRHRIDRIETDELVAAEPLAS